MTEAKPTVVHAGSILDWNWDWSAWLNLGDQIAGHELLMNSGLTLVGNSSVSGSIVKATLQVASTMTSKRVLIATCKITTSAGLQEQWPIYLTVK